MGFLREVGKYLIIIDQISKARIIIYIIRSNNYPMMLTVAKMQIKIVDITQKEHVIEVSKQMTGFQLKQHIYSNLTKELKTKQMKLTYEGQELQNNVKLSYFNIAIGNMLTFVQTRIDLSKVSSILVHNIQDPIFSQEYTYQWPCGHYIGQLGINAHIKAIISNNQSVIRCPFELENGNKCAFEWDYSICKKIGVFTAQEKKYFQNALSQNFANQNMKNCPKCSQIFLNEQKVNRVRCPHPNCKYGDFCFKCLGPWSEPKSTTFCGSETCRFANDFLTTAPWDRVFTVTDPKTKKQIAVKTPKFRACPKCYVVVQNFINCKHTKCSNPKCLISFCWICLSIHNTNWECGSYNQYCGKVAQVQKYQTNK